MFNLNYEKIRKWAVIYMTLPVVLFFLGWLKIWIAIPSVLLLGYGAYCVINRRVEEHIDGSKGRNINISWKVLAGLVLLSLAWCFFAGQGGFYYQSPDYGCRNAVLRDMINFDWPVIYKDYGNAMVYYIAYWMPAALIGKTVLVITASADAAWLAGNIALLLWSTCGVFIVFLLFIYSVNANTTKKIWATVLLFIFFSGCDIVGQQILGGEFAWHIEWWNSIYQYSSITTCLFWVFNQSVIPWMVIMCLINEKNVKNYAYIGLMCLPVGPFPFLGVFIYCVLVAIKWGVDAIREKSFDKYIKSMFTVSNLTAILIVVPIFWTYFTCNAAMTNAGTGGGFCFFWQEVDVSPISGALVYILFYLLEVGLYLLLIRKDYRKNIWFHITAVSLMFIALFRMGGSVDFAMRVSIPGITITAFLVIRYLVNHYEDLKSSDTTRKSIYALLIIVYFMGVFTPGFEFARGINEVAKNHKLNVVCDDVVTFDKEGGFTNFVTQDYSEKFFFKYLAR